MITHHKNNDLELSIISAIKNHSADKVVVYKEVFGEPIYLAYYLPKEYSCSSRYPVFVFVHGGSWSSHEIFPDQTCWQGDYLGYLARYYAEKGFVCVSIDYRLVRDQGQAENYGVIDCYEDCCDAMDYIINHAGEYGIDTQQMYLLGESAGGHLAGSCGIFWDDERIQKAIGKTNNNPNAMILAYPVVTAIGPTHLLSFMNLTSITELTEEDKKAWSLELHVKPTCPPTFIVHAINDKTVPINNALCLAEALSENSVDYEMHILPEGGHGFSLAENEVYKEDNPYVSRWVDWAIDWLKKIFINN